MGLGLGLLRLPPVYFWSMTPRELKAATDMIFGSSGSPKPPARSDLAALMTRFPDHADHSEQQEN